MKRMPSNPSKYQGFQVSSDEGTGYSAVRTTRELQIELTALKPVSKRPLGPLTSDLSRVIAF